MRFVGLINFYIQQESSGTVSCQILQIKIGKQVKYLRAARIISGINTTPSIILSCDKFLIKLE
jgi:hypothetical protein